MFSADKLLTYINSARAEYGDNWGKHLLEINFKKGMQNPNSDKAIFYDVYIIDRDTGKRIPIEFLHKLTVPSQILPYNKEKPILKTEGEFQRFETRDKPAQLSIYKYSNMPRVNSKTNEFEPAIKDDEPISPAFMVISYISDYVYKQLRSMIKLGTDVYELLESKPYEGPDKKAKFAHYKRLLDSKNIDLNTPYTMMGDNNLRDLINEILVLNPETKDKFDTLVVLTKSTKFAQTVKLKAGTLKLQNPMIFTKLELRSEKEAHMTKDEIAKCANRKDAFKMSKKIRILDRSEAKNAAEADAISDGYTPTDPEIGDYIKRGQTVLVVINMSGLNTSNLGISLKPKIEGNFIIYKQPSAGGTTTDNLSEMLAAMTDMDDDEIGQFASFKSAAEPRAKLVVEDLSLAQEFDALDN